MLCIVKSLCKEAMPVCWHVTIIYAQVNLKAYAHFYICQDPDLQLQVYAAFVTLELWRLYLQLEDNAMLAGIVNFQDQYSS